MMVSGDRIWQWRQWASDLALRKDVPLREVDWLLQYYIPELDALALRLNTYRSARLFETRCSLDALTEQWEKRVQKRVPVQHITGITPWRKFSLHVSPAVLIPRPETELLIDLAMQATQNDPTLRTGQWVDMGTGSGAIALGIADAFPEAIVHAVDYSPDALAIARKNAEALGMGHRIHFHQGSWFEPIQHLQGGLSGMISNPPYIPTAQVPDLQPEVANHEPHLALNGGSDGLDAIRHLAREAPAYLKFNGLWLVEMMAGQAEMVTNLLSDDAFHDVSIHPDLASIERFAIAYRN